MSSGKTDAARASKARENAGKRMSSTARSIAWGYWIRRFAAFVCFDLTLVVVLVASFVVQCNTALPEEARNGIFLAQDFRAVVVGVPDALQMGPFRIPLTFVDGSAAAQGGGAAYRVVAPSGELHDFPVSGVHAVWVSTCVLVVVAEVFSLASGMFETRRIRRQLKPLNDLALAAEAIGSAAAIDPSYSLRSGRASAAQERPDEARDGLDKIESLEHAISSASVDSPRIATGDKDLRSIEVALNSLLRQMQEAKLQQMRFVSDASHELRTPIAVIQGYVNMLDRWGKTDEGVLDESIEALKSEAAHMQELVEQLLFLARGDSGRNTLEKTTFNLAKVVREVCEESAMIDGTHVYATEATESDEADARYDMVGDLAMVKQSLRIMVQNAKAYSAEGKKVTVSVAARGGNVGYAVQDEGIGMSSNDIAHIFDRFYRSDQARDKRSGGTGLGLAIAKWIVEAHEGSIEVLSHEGIGTRFTVWFPAA